MLIVEQDIDWLSIANEDGFFTVSNAAPWLTLAHRGDFEMAARCLTWDRETLSRAATQGLAESSDPPCTTDDARAMYESVVMRLRHSYTVGRPLRFRDHARRRGLLDEKAAAEADVAHEAFKREIQEAANG